MTYVYADVTQHAGAVTNIGRGVATKTLGGTNVTSGTWTYTYGTGSNQDTTRVECPCGTTTYRFNGIGTSGSFSGWLAGSLAERTVERLASVHTELSFELDVNAPEVQMAASPQGAAAATIITYAVAAGQRGEQLVRSAFTIGSRVATQINGRIRVPDGTTLTKINEVKNVGYQALTSQIRDYIQLAPQVPGRTLDLWVRTNTIISGPLAAEASKPGGVLRIIPILPPR